MIVRAPRPHGNFYVLDKAISEDARLSWAARGLLVFLLGKPDHWQVSPTALVNETAKCSKPSGRDAVYGLLGELRDAGYLLRSQERNPDGSMGGVRYLVSESPLPALPETAGPHPVNPTQVSIDEKQELKKKEESAREKVELAQGESGFELLVPIATREQYLRAYPGVDVPMQIARAEAWINANPSKRPKSQISRFLNGWMARAHRDLTAPMGRPMPKAPATKRERRDAFMDHLFGNQPGGANVVDVVATEVRG